MQKSYWIENLYAEDIRGFEKNKGANKHVADESGSGLMVGQEQQIIQEPSYHSMQALIEPVSDMGAGNNYDHPEYQVASK